MRRSTLKVGQLSKKSACLIHTRGCRLLHHCFIWSFIKTCNVSMVFVMVSVRKMPRIWMTSMWTLVAKALVMKSNINIMLGTFGCHPGYYDAYRKLVKSVILLSKDFEKVFADYDLTLTVQQLQAAFDSFSNHDPVAMWRTCWSFQLTAGLQGFRFLLVLRKGLQSVCSWLV